MFSGVIGYRGKVVAFEQGPGGGAVLRILCDGVRAERPEPKDSIAIDGVCLTATVIADDIVTFDVVPETLACSALGERTAGDAVNVEYSLRAGERLGGHLVYGHVDAAATVLRRTAEGNGERLRLSLPPSLAAMVPLKAFVALDGVSLTVAAVGNDWFEVALIPETIARTTLGRRQTGSRVNLEIDPLARYAKSAVLNLLNDWKR